MRDHTALRLGAASALTVLTLVVTGCTDRSEDTGAGPDTDSTPSATATDSTSASAGGAPDASPGASATEAAGAPLELLAETETSACFVDERVRDLAWLDVQWHAHDDLDSFELRLENADDLRIVGQPVNVPVDQTAQRTGFSAHVPWEERAEWLNDVRFLDWARRKPLASVTPAGGEAGLLAVHLRATDPSRAATVSRVVADWVTRDGRSGSTRADVDVTYRWGGCD